MPNLISLSRKLLISIVTGLTLYSSAYAHYCTQKNFDTGDMVHNQSVASYQRAIDILNPLVEQYNQEEFIHRKLSFERILNVLIESDGSLTESMKLHIATLKAQIADAKKAQISFDSAKKRIPTAFGIWDKIAASCYDIDESENARKAKANAKKGRDFLTKIESAESKYEFILDAYQKEVDFLTKALKGYQSVVNCK